MIARAEHCSKSRLGHLFHRSFSRRRDCCCTANATLNYAKDEDWCYIKHNVTTPMKRDDRKTPDDNPWGRSPFSQFSAPKDLSLPLPKCEQFDNCSTFSCKLPSRFFTRWYTKPVSCKLNMRTAWLAACSDLGTARARAVPSNKTRYNLSAVTTLLPLFSSRCKSHLSACSSFYNPQPLLDLHF